MNGYEIERSPDRQQTAGEPPVMTPISEVRGGFIGNRTLFSDQHHLRSDLHLTRRAIRENWPMTPEDRLWIWAKATEIRSKHEGRIAAAAASTLDEIRKADGKFAPRNSVSD